MPAERRTLCADHQHLRHDEVSFTCSCRRFYLTSLHCSHHQCHKLQVVYTDGACSGNGQAGATSGIGWAIGDSPDMQWMASVDDSIDQGPRTNQRAELLAALHGLKSLADQAHHIHSNRRFVLNPNDPIQRTENWTVATDSAYVVNGITDWIHAWRAKKWRTAKGKIPDNLDLFQKLEAAISDYEQQNNAKIEFLHIGREYNQLADSLARRGAAQGLRR
ncbi:ribonuclease H-like domain-containing protein [Mycena floridula]|nr:ribonuclease H-like domain-containing protein [Mycena floridula]